MNSLKRAYVNSYMIVKFNFKCLQPYIVTK